MDFENGDMNDELMLLHELQQCEAFMQESNRIEGENRIYTDDAVVCLAFIRHGEEKKLSKAQFLKHHKKLSAHRDDMEYKGMWRKCDVFVGRYAAPSWKRVSGLMYKFFEELPRMDAWTAHNRFQKIHPFEDLNGRMGRLLWLYCMVRDGQDPFNRSFLHWYYYQSLSHFPFMA